MKKILAQCLSLILAASALAQTPTQQPTAQPPAQQDEEILRVTTALVQVDAVVVDKNDRPVPDLKMSDFEVYENGKKQNLQFMEFVGGDTDERRVEGNGDLAKAVKAAPGVELTPSRDLSAREVRRTFAFVVDDLTIPIEDMVTVRQMLTDFVNNQMREGDLVAIIRSVGGKGLLQQFTSDKAMLRRAIAQLNVSTNPFAAYNTSPEARFNSAPTLASAAQAAPGEAESVSVGGNDTSFEDFGIQNFSDPNDETVRLFRGLASLSTAKYTVESMKDIPGRKSMVLITGGIPIFEVASTGTAYSNVTYLLNQLTDDAVRSGVAISTMDPRGLKATPGVAHFTDTPARSALGSAPDPNFGRGGSSAGRADIPSSMAGDSNTGGDDPFGPLLAGGSEHLGLNTVASATGGVSVVNTNNFRSGLEKVVAHSAGYYVLAYAPVEKFDNKFRRIQIKVKRDGVRVYTHQGYLARADRPASAAPTKEEAIMAAAKSPLARRDLDVTANVMLKPSPASNKSAVDVHLQIDPKKLNFTQTPDGRHQTSFDVVGFVYDQLGRMRGGFSETVKTDLSEENYRKAMATGLTYTATTELPPGYYQIRGAVREEGSGNLGTISKYLEVPDLNNGKLAMSSIFLFAADAGSKAQPTPLLAVRQLSRKQDLRYAAIIYNAKSSSGGPQVKTQVIISQGGKILYREPESAVASNGASSPLTKIGQVGLSGVSPGRYVLSLVVTDPLADKKSQIVARSIDFTVTN